VHGEQRQLKGKIIYGTGVIELKEEKKSTWHILGHKIKIDRSKSGKSTQNSLQYYQLPHRDYNSHLAIMELQLGVQFLGLAFEI